jgi:hypothetical protein
MTANVTKTPPYPWWKTTKKTKRDLSNLSASINEEMKKLRHTEPKDFGQLFYDDQTCEVYNKAGNTVAYVGPDLMAALRKEAKR